MKNSIISRLYWAIKVELISPISISNGESEETDSDVLCNGKGVPFIPGTSLAGAFRTALVGEKSKIFGFADGDKGAMSGIFISDLYFENKPVISVRDGVQLEDNKTVKNKFDMQIIETGCEGIIYISCIVREKDNAELYTDAVNDIVEKLNSGEIRLGGNKNRGFGRLKVCTIYSKKFTHNEVDEFVEFKSNSHNITAYGDGVEFENWKKDITPSESNCIFIKVPLKLNGGISIRKYSTKPNAPDYEHITANGVPVIPGTSWNGAIRSQVKNILRELGLNEQRVNEIINCWFGFVPVNEKSENKAIQSNIVFGESVIENAVKMSVSRNKINRFDGSTVAGALYTESAYFGGNTLLEIIIKQDASRHYEALVGIMQLVIEDICNGYVPVGGLAAIGRGIFSKDTDVDNAEQYEFDFTRYNKAFAEFIKKEKEDRA